MAKQFWNSQNTAQKTVLIVFGVLLVVLLSVQLWMPGVFTTNIR